MRDTARVEPRTTRPIVGRAPERAALDGAVEALAAGSGGVIVLRGEPGIGKSRLLADLAERAESVGAAVLGARASEFEGDLPYALWSDALDPLAGELSRLDLPDPAALGAVLPSLALAGADADRHRVHRALRGLLAQLAAARPVVACLDDVHWADAASADALAALLRRPPAGPVLLALAARAGRLPAALGTALGRRGARRPPARVRPCAAQRGRGVRAGRRRGALRARGREPVLPRAAGAGGRDCGGQAAPSVGGVPAAVAAALAAELAALGADARRLLDGAAVAGDPFDPGLAAAAADLPEAAALRALDELLEHALVRPAGAPRRFAFRHPVVRHAVYVATPGGWRLGAHARAASVLERQGAGPVQRAHHVEHAAAPGDAAAAALLVAAADELRSPAPAGAARWYAAALRLMPAGGIELRAHLADAQAAAGDAAAARATLLEALDVAAPADRLRLAVALANQEWRLGANADARRRLHVALGDLPAEPSPDRIRLRLALALTTLMECDLAGAQAHCRDARDDARAIGDPVFEFAALACLALARASAADPGTAAALDVSVAALERLSPAQLATRLPGLWMHGRARRSLGRFDEALIDLRRAAAIAVDTGREAVLLSVAVESVGPLIQLGRIGAAIAAAEEGVEVGRLAGNPRTLLWALCALAEARLAAGDVAGALRHAEEAAALALNADFHAAGQPGWCLGAALTAAGNAEQAVPVLLEAIRRPAAAARAAGGPRGGRHRSRRGAAGARGPRGGG